LAVQALQSQHYKVILLSLSHAPQPSKIPRNLDLRPNYLLTPQNVLTFFEALRMHAHSSNAPVLGHVFATHGLDLAIPGVVEYRPAIDSYTRQVEYRSCPTTGMDLKFLPNAALERIHLASLQRRSPFALRCHGQPTEGPLYNYTAADWCQQRSQCLVFGIQRDNLGSALYPSRLRRRPATAGRLTSATAARAASGLHNTHPRALQISSPDGY
jgi:hypothetical protein